MPLKNTMLIEEARQRILCTSALGSLPTDILTLHNVFVRAQQRLCFAFRSETLDAEAAQLRDQTLIK